MQIQPLIAPASTSPAGSVPQDIVETTPPLPPPRFDNSRARSEARAAGMLTSSMTRPPVFTKSLRADLVGDEEAEAALLKVVASHIDGGGSLLELVDQGRWSAAVLYDLALQLGSRAGNLSSLAQRYASEAELLLQHRAVDIHAALNTANALTQAAGTTAERNWLRGLYVDTVKGQISVNELFDTLLERFGPSDFRKGAMGMIAALNDDLNARAASTAVDHLQVLVLSSLVAARRLLTLMQGLRDLLIQSALVSEQAFEEVCPQNEREKQHEKGSSEQRRDDGDQLTALLLRNMLQAMSPGASPSALRSAVDAMVEDRLPPTQAAQFHRDFLSYLHALPNALWRELPQKDRLLDALRKSWLSATLAHGNMSVSSR